MECTIRTLIDCPFSQLGAVAGALLTGLGSFVSLFFLGVWLARILSDDQ